VVPITTALLVVLFFLILSYRQTIKAYPTAGTAALASAFSVFAHWILPISIAFVIVIAWGNLRGVRESGKLFAVPTYFFIVNMAILIVVGVVRALNGSLAKANYAHATGVVQFGSKGSGLLVGAGLAVVLHSFASGGAAVTGVEAISNGVPAFKKPEWKNARTTLVIMGSLLGVMFLGLSIMDAHMHVAPYVDGTPTVISQIGKLAYGTSALGTVLWLCLQAGTMLILVLAANTSFADFPRLASFHAGDNFMPRQLTKRGHRLVFSNGIIFLAAFAIVLLLLTDARVDKLIPLYAIGVFLSFTLSQAGMAKHHIREKEQGWRTGLFINGTGAVLSAIVCVVIAVFKFKPPHTWIGAWIIIVFVPIMVFFLVRLARQYKTEDEALAHDVPKAVAAPVRKRLVVMVFVDRLDLAVARAMQFGRSLRPDELRAVHFVIDDHSAEHLAGEWREYGLANLGLELIDCPDRRLTRSAVEVVAHELSPGDAEVCVILPERKFNGAWHKILHDGTAESLSREISRLPHANVTIVPFHFDERETIPVAATPAVDATNGHHKAESNGSGNGSGNGRRAKAKATIDLTVAARPPDATPIGEVRCRQSVKIHGRVQAVRVEPLGGSPSLECTLADDTGSVSMVFFGRRAIEGIVMGATITAEGMALDHHGRLAIVNPLYELR
jgi:amino acid transporter